MIERSRETPWETALLNEILRSRRNDYRDNFDPWMRFDPCFREQHATTLRERFIEARVPLGYQISADRSLSDAVFPTEFYRSLIEHECDFGALYDLLGDRASKELLVKLQAWKVLGHKKVKLPRNTPKFWADLARMKDLEAGSGIKIAFANLELPLMDVSPLGYDIKANLHHTSVTSVFVQKQYEYHGADFMLKADRDDVVLDCGACWGETTLYFAHEVGRNGKVYAFEFTRENLSVLRANLDLNPHLRSAVEIIEHAVWDASGVDISYVDNGPGSSVTTDAIAAAPKCSTLAIDDFVETRRLDRVDFIKMDIEGAEVPALKGALKTLQRFTPKLAISAYHKPDDLRTIPTLVNELGLAYEFYLDHHTIHVWETVLYCWPRRRKIAVLGSKLTMGMSGDN
jgi:FkbM family methyltransferase